MPAGRAVRRMGAGGVVRARQAWPGPGGAARHHPGALPGHTTRSLAARRHLLPELPAPRRMGAAAAMAVAVNVSLESARPGGRWAAAEVLRAQTPCVQRHEARLVVHPLRIEPAGVPGRLLRSEEAAQLAHCPVDIVVARLTTAGGDRLTHLTAGHATDVDEQLPDPCKQHHLGPRLRPPSRARVRLLRRPPRCRHGRR